MSKNILVTGGSGFIGSHLVDSLVKKGNLVTIFDSLVPENYGEQRKHPEYLSKNAKFIQADVRDYDALQDAIQDKEIIFHLAAELGIGRSMYMIRDFIENNTLGTSNLLDILANANHDVKKLIVASSCSIYGEGRVICEKCGIFKPKMRNKKQMKAQKWEILCPDCGEITHWAPTKESDSLDCTSIYAYSKLHQEHLSMLVGKTYGIKTTALRFFNVLGPRQALSNPYTGVCAIFATSALSGNPPLVYEDGNQGRDFVNVLDIVQALNLSLEKTVADYEIFNVGTGKATSVAELCHEILDAINPEIKPKITNKGRYGDVRNIIADISRIKEKLNYRPQYDVGKSLEMVLSWIHQNFDKKTVRDKTDEVQKDLKKKGIL